MQLDKLSAQYVPDISIYNGTSANEHPFTGKFTVSVYVSYL